MTIVLPLVSAAPKLGLGLGFVMGFGGGASSSEEVERTIPVEVVVALDVGLVVAEEHAVRAPEDLRALHGGEGVLDRGLELRRGLGGRDGREGRDGRGEGEGESELGHFCK